MCGIAGVVGVGARRHADRVVEMVRALDHRGPDDHGVEVFDDAVIGAARLAVIDPAGGHQPLRTATAALVCNGEIYGHDRIRAATPEYPYSTRSDVEPILALYARHGEAMLEHLPGTFALALWDDAVGRLVLARDRFGERPCFWTVTSDGCVAFASEVQALRLAGFAGTDVDRESLSHMVRQGYVPPGRSIWSGVRSLTQAEALIWERGATPRVQRWWHPPEPDWTPRLDEARVWFETELSRSVSEQLDSDVPIGTLLSGGLDSSTVAALAAARRPHLPAFCFDMPGDSELGFATEVARHANLDLHPYRPDPDTLSGDLLRVAAHWDEPFGDSSALPTYLLCEWARRHVTVVLAGDGADELLGGYVCWNRDLLATPVPRRRSGLAHRWGPLRGARNGPQGVSAVARRYSSFRSYLRADDLRALGLPVTRDDWAVPPTCTHGTADDLTRYDLDHYLPGDILTKTDRASMAHGLEVRAPFLDVTLATGLLRLRSEYKVDATRDKTLLRDSFVGLLPSAVASRTKQGFGAPLGAWLEGPLRGLVHDTLIDPDSPLFELVEPGGVAPWANSCDQRTWNLLALGLWWQTHRSTAP